MSGRGPAVKGYSTSNVQHYSLYYSDVLWMERMVEEHRDEAFDIIWKNMVVRRASFDDIVIDCLSPFLDSIDPGHGFACDLAAYTLAVEYARRNTGTAEIWGINPRQQTFLTKLKREYSGVHDVYARNRSAIERAARAFDADRWDIQFTEVGPVMVVNKGDCGPSGRPLQGAIDCGISYALPRDAPKGTAKRPKAKTASKPKAKPKPKASASRTSKGVGR